MWPLVMYWSLLNSKYLALKKSVSPYTRDVTSQTEPRPHLLQRAAWHYKKRLLATNIEIHSCLTHFMQEYAAV